MTMNKTNIHPGLLLTLILCCQSIFAWQAGFDSQIFPATSPVKSNGKELCLAGYGMFCNRKATGVHDPVGAQSLFLTDEQTHSLLFISLDAIGFSQAMATAVRKRIATETLLPEENIILTATHTHSSMDLQGLWGGLNREQQKAIIETIVDTARNAWTNLYKVSLHAATGRNLKSFNRRTKNSDIIHQILSVQLRHKQEDGREVPFVTFFTLGSHPVVLDKENSDISSDWVHYSRSVLAREFNAPAMFVNGVLGDVLPGNGNPRTFVYAETYGTKIAEQVVNSLKESKQLKSSLRYCTETLEDKADNNLLVLRTKFLRHGTVEWKHIFSNSFQTRTSVIVLDDVVLLTTPGEPVTAMGKSLMALVQGNPVAVLGLTHDSLGYLIPEQYIMDNGHEERVMISHTISDKVARSLQGLVQKCLPQQ